MNLKRNLLIPAAVVLVAALVIPSRILAATETQITGDASGTSSITGTTNWMPTTTVAPTDALASTNDYVTAVTSLRTPSGTGNYTVHANSLTINSGGRLGFKGSGLLTIPNLILNGGQIANNATGGNPDIAQLAGSINLAGNSTLTPNGAGTTLNILSAITNAANVSATLTMQNGGTVLLSAQNTFNGNITVVNTSPSTILQ